MQTIRVVALLACIALVSFVDAQTTCPACSLSQCAMQGCGVDAPYVCLAGISAGGCNTAPWTNASICTECCDASGCSTMPRFNCSGTCSAEMCHSKKRCADTSPYMCTSGNGTYGCSASPNYWPIMPQCDACCDVKTCENTCTEACTADQCQSNPCTPTSPFLCTGGPLANACSNSPTYFGHDSQCYGCCNSSSCGSSRFSCESKPCPSSVCHSVDRCSLTTKYMCINGSASNGCSASPSYWPSYPQCTDCCDVTSCAFTCPPCTADQCQTNPCTPWDPYVCTAGPLKNGCSGSASYFGQQAQCFSCCDSSSC